MASIHQVWPFPYVQAALLPKILAAVVDAPARQVIAGDFNMVPWEGAFTLADVSGTDLIDRATLGLLGRSLALRGEWVALITDDGLVSCSDWTITTKNGKPTAYRLTIPETGGAKAVTALAGEVMHVRIGASPSAPYYGSAPLRRAALSAGLLTNV